MPIRLSFSLVQFLLWLTQEVTTAPKLNCIRISISDLQILDTQCYPLHLFTMIFCKPFGNTCSWHLTHHSRFKVCPFLPTLHSPPSLPHRAPQPTHLSQQTPHYHIDQQIRINLAKLMLHNK